MGRQPPGLQALVRARTLCPTRSRGRSRPASSPELRPPYAPGVLDAFVDKMSDFLEVRASDQTKHEEIAEARQGRWTVRGWSASERQAPVKPASTETSLWKTKVTYSHTTPASSDRIEASSGAVRPVG